jgi:Fe-S-cluster containining protein
MNSCCKGYSCIKCCLKTRMPLSYKDINRIKSLGFNTNFFITKKNGWVQLKNKNGRCVFHTGVVCTIYKDRPEGCKLYPVIYDKDEDCAILDIDCPHRENFLKSEKIIKKLYCVVSKLENERTDRRKMKN